MAKEDIKAAHPEVTSPPVPEVNEPPVPEVPQVKTTKIPNLDGHHGGGRLDRTVKGGMIVARVMDNTHFQVQNAEGEPIPGKIFDPIKKCIVDA